MENLLCGAAHRLLWMASVSTHAILGAPGLEAPAFVHVGYNQNSWEHFWEVAKGWARPELPLGHPNAVASDLHLE
jgi:hypothetical protein